MGVGGWWGGEGPFSILGRTKDREQLLSLIHQVLAADIASTAESTGDRTGNKSEEVSDLISLQFNREGWQYVEGVKNTYTLISTHTHTHTPPCVLMQAKLNYINDHMPMCKSKPLQYRFYCIKHVNFYQK